MKQCKFCSKEFESKNKLKIYCSSICLKRNWYKNNPNAKKEEYWRNKKTYQKYSKARWIKNKKEIKRICLNCSVEYIQNNNPKYCSTKCRSQYISRQQYWKHRDKKLIEMKRYRDSKEGKLKRTFLQLKRQRKIRNLKENFTYKEWKQKLKNTFGVCPICNKFIGINNLTKDHIKPITKVPDGFVYNIDDVQPMCLTCNSKKGAKI